MGCALREAVTTTGISWNSKSSFSWDHNQQSNAVDIIMLMIINCNRNNAFDFEIIFSIKI
jgi:hypothetical protein